MNSSLQTPEMTCNDCIHLQFLGAGKCSCAKVSLMLSEDLTRLTICKKNNFKEVEQTKNFSSSANFVNTRNNFYNAGYEKVLQNKNIKNNIIFW